MVAGGPEPAFFLVGDTAGTADTMLAHEGLDLAQRVWAVDGPVHENPPGRRIDLVQPQGCIV